MSVGRKRKGNKKKNGVKGGATGKSVAAEAKENNIINVVSLEKRITIMNLSHINSGDVDSGDIQ